MWLRSFYHHAPLLTCSKENAGPDLHQLVNITHGYFQLRPSIRNLNQRKWEKKLALIECKHEMSISAAAGSRNTGLWCKLN